MEKSKKDWLFEVIIGLTAFMFSVIYFIFSLSVAVQSKMNIKMNSIGPEVFPKAIGIVAIFVSLTILVPALINYLKTPADTPDTPVTQRPPVITKDRMLILVSLIIYLFVMKYIGYMISTFILSMVILNHMKREKWKRNLIYSIVFSVVCFLVFNNLLSIWLPIGTIFQSFL